MNEAQKIIKPYYDLSITTNDIRFQKICDSLNSELSEEKLTRLIQYLQSDKIDPKADELRTKLEALREEIEKCHPVEVTQVEAVPVPAIPAKKIEPSNVSSESGKLITYHAGTPLEIHPAADLFPMQTATGFESLCENIKTQGQRDPIIICRGKIIDGRNRYKACLALNIEIKAVEEDIPDEQIMGRVYALNILRKQLSSGQRAVIALSEREQLQAEASERMLSGKPCGKNSTGSKTDEILARKYMTNAKYIAMAAEIASNPELLKKVFDGDMDIRAAYHKLKPRPKKKEIPQSTLPRYVLEKLVEFFSPAKNSELQELIAHTSGELKKMLSKKLAELESR